MRIPILPKQPKVFSLSTPMHLLDKLRWEIAGFQRSMRSRSLARHLLPAYHAFNCAVTSWHMTDWTWSYIGQESQRELAAKYKLEDMTLRSFQDALAKASRALNACQEIANGSKHREVTRKRADPHVRAESTWGLLESSPKHPEGKYDTQWTIIDQIGSRPALQVFIEAAAYWHQFLTPWREHVFIGGSRPRRKHR